jgi:hypothetical protein
MNKYKVKIDSEALKDIQEITDWYNEAQTTYGKMFQATAIKQIDSLSKNPQVYATFTRSCYFLIIVFNQVSSGIIVSFGVFQTLIFPLFAFTRSHIKLATLPVLG